MIKVKLTQNYTGFNNEGTTFDDFYELYDNISYFLGIEECFNVFTYDSGEYYSYYYIPDEIRESIKEELGF